MKPSLPPIHPAGWPFIGICAAVTLVVFNFSLFFGLLALIVAGWCIYFFRHPPRVTPIGKGLIISPADGMLIQITQAVPPKELKWETKPLTRLSIFLNVFDVHVNRSPVEGTAKRIVYHPGKFFNASLDKASKSNERNSLIVSTPSGQEVLVVQIAGLIARRILCEIKEGHALKAGDPFGIIRFGSRVDIYLPEGVSPQVMEGQRMIGGETILAQLPTKSRAKEEH